MAMASFDNFLTEKKTRVKTIKEYSWSDHNTALENYLNDLPPGYEVIGIYPLVDNFNVVSIVVTRKEDER